MKTLPLTRIVAMVCGASLASVAFPSFNQTPTDSWYQTNVSLAQISQMDKNGFRPVSFDNVANGNSAPRYNVTYVRNSGSHYKKWILAELKTVDQLNGPAYAGYRMIDVFLRYDGPAPKYSALFIQNTGADKRDWYWRRLSVFSTMISEARTKGYKPLSFDMVLLGGPKYTSVFVKNVGTPDETAWWAYPSIPSGTFVTDKARDLNATPTVLDEGLVLEKRKSTDRVGSFVGASTSWIDDITDRLGVRVESLTSTGSNKYNGLLVSNITEDSAKFVDDMVSKTDGKVGIYMRDLSSAAPILWHRHQTRFYPSSTMKIFLAFHAIKNTVAYSTATLPVWPNHISDTHNGETPTWTTMPNVVGPMLISSNNQMANTIIDRFGRSAINSTLSFYSMPNSLVVNKLGTGPYTPGDKSYATLTDFGTMYERIHQNSVFDVNRRNFLYNNMISSKNGAMFDTVINTEAASLGVSATNRNAFKAKLEWCAKAGSNGKPGAVPAFNGYGSIAGYAKVPNKNGTFKAFVFGLYTVECDEKNNVSLWGTGAELLRKQIRAALQTWK
jgi:hypothetical protein